MEKKRALKIRKIIVLCLGIGIPLIVTIVCICISIFGKNSEEGTGNPWVQWVIILWFPLSLTWIFRMFTDCKVYEYEGHEIEVYYGRQHRYMKLDGKTVDRDNKVLKCTLEDGTQIEAKKSLKRPIVLRINNRVYEEEKE